MDTCNDASRDKSLKAPTMSEAVRKSQTQCCWLWFKVQKCKCILQYSYLTLICGFLSDYHTIDQVMMNTYWWIKRWNHFKAVKNCGISEFDVRVCIKWKAHNPCSNFFLNNCRYYSHSSSLVLAQLFIQQGWLWTKVVVGKEYRSTSHFYLQHAVTTMYQSIF